jgi:hypothetical protein
VTSSVPQVTERGRPAPLEQAARTEIATGVAVTATVAVAVAEGDERDQDRTNRIEAGERGPDPNATSREQTSTWR